MGIDQKIELIKKELVGYIWSGTGEELEAANSLETIFVTLREISLEFKNLNEQKEHWLTEYVKLKR